MKIVHYLFLAGFLLSYFLAEIINLEDHIVRISTAIYLSIYIVLLFTGTFAHFLEENTGFTFVICGFLTVIFFPSQVENGEVVVKETWNNIKENAYKILFSCKKNSN